MLLAQSAQDASRREPSAAAAPDADGDGAAAAAARHPLEAPIHPSAIPAHLLPLHMQRTQQQLHDTGLELYSQVCEIDRQLEDATLEATPAADTQSQPQPAAQP